MSSEGFRGTEPFNFKKLLGFTSFFQGSGSVRNALRIWASTPRCTSHLGEYAAKTEPTGPGVKIRSKNGQLNASVRGRSDTGPGANDKQVQELRRLYHTNHIHHINHSSNLKMIISPS